MEINTQSLKIFREDFQKAVSDLEKKYGVIIKLGNITYSDIMFHARVDVKNRDALDEIDEREFDRNVYRYTHLGFQEGMYRRIFIGKGNEYYAILGFNPRSKKIPLKVVRVRDGVKLLVGQGYVRKITEEYYIPNLAELSEEDLLEK